MFELIYRVCPQSEFQQESRKYFCLFCKTRNVHKAFRMKTKVLEISQCFKRGSIKARKTIFKKFVLKSRSVTVAATGKDGALLYYYFKQRLNCSRFCSYACGKGKEKARATAVTVRQSIPMFIFVTVFS